MVVPINFWCTTPTKRLKNAIFRQKSAPCRNFGGRKWVLPARGGRKIFGPRQNTTKVFAKKFSWCWYDFGPLQPRKSPKMLILVIFGLKMAFFRNFGIQKSRLWVRGVRPAPEKFFSKRKSLKFFVAKILGLHLNFFGFYRNLFDIEEIVAKREGVSGKGISIFLHF